VKSGSKSRYRIVYEIEIKKAHGYCDEFHRLGGDRSDVN
jgi:hypothetical protein